MANGALRGEVPMPRVTVTTTGSSVVRRAVVESGARAFASEGTLVESCERAVSVKPSGNAKSIATRAMNVIGLDNRRIEHADGSPVAFGAIVNRREFLGLTVSATLVRGRFAAVFEPRVLRIELLLPATASASTRDVSAGAALALSESQRAGQLFGQSIRLSTRPSGSSMNGAALIIGGMPADDCRALSRMAEEKGIVFFNIGATADSLRRAECTRHMFHIAASDAMIAAARAAVGPGNPSPATIELWQSTLERYGGSQLNDRFRARFGRPMTSRAWAGWVAVKIAWEASLRAGSTDPTAILTFLEKETTQFDGHKGTPLSFRAWDHQLRQPLYAVAGAKVVAEVPDVGKGGEQSQREQLDRFGDSPGKCVMAPTKRNYG